MSYEILIPDKVNYPALFLAIISLLVSLTFIVISSSLNSLYLIIGLLILSGLASTLKFQIQLKFINIVSVGLIFIGLIVLYSFISFEQLEALELFSIILFYLSSIYVSKAYTTIQENVKNKKD